MEVKEHFELGIQPRSASKDVMATYKRLNLKNHTSIPTKLEKFLVINMSFEAIEKLSCRMACLDLKIADFKKKLNEGVKTASAAANKSDDATWQSDLLLK